MRVDEIILQVGKTYELHLTYEVRCSPESRVFVLLSAMKVDIPNT